MMNVMDKIETQVTSLQKKIDALSGNYLTNTWKRQQEQRGRDQQISRYRLQMQVLQYLGEAAGCGDLTPLEKAILVGAFHEEIRSMLESKKHAVEHNYPYKLDFPTWNEARAKRLRKAGIFDTAQLVEALAEYERLVEKAVIPPNPHAARIRDLTFKARLGQGGDIQFTPAPLVEKMLMFAKLDEGSRVLEPEAGIGYIADAVKKVTPHVDCIEIGCDFRELLELKGHHLIGCNFLEQEQLPVYDAVLMNPPFSAEFDHIRYAYGFLKPGGVLVAVCSNRVVHPSSMRKDTAFQEWLSTTNYHLEKTDAKFEMTGAFSALLVIWNMESDSTY